MVHHAELLGLFRGEARGREQQFLGLSGAELPRVAVVLHAADAHAHDRVGELGVLGSDDQVARPAQQQATGDALALHGSDRGFTDVTPLAGVPDVALGLPLVDRFQPADLEVARELVAVARGAFGRAGDVVAGREVLAVRLQHDDPHGLVVGGLHEDGVEQSSMAGVWAFALSPRFSVMTAMRSSTTSYNTKSSAMSFALSIRAAWRRSARSPRDFNVRVIIIDVEIKWRRRDVDWATDHPAVQPGRRQRGHRRTDTRPRVHRVSRSAADLRGCLRP